MTPSTKSTRTNIAFVFDDLADWQQLVAGVPPDTQVVVLDGLRDGLAQIAAYLHGREGVDAIHILSHGQPGQLQLGSLALDQATLVAHAAVLRQIGDALSHDGDLLLYGCDVAAGSAGQAFVRALATATGADISASDDMTGAAAKGGNWKLEMVQGSVETASLSGFSAYGGLLAAPSSETFDGVVLSGSYSYGTSGAPRTINGWTFTLLNASGAQDGAGYVDVTNLSSDTSLANDGSDKATLLNGTYAGGTGQAAAVLKATSGEEFAFVSVRVETGYSGGSDYRLVGYRDGSAVAGATQNFTAGAFGGGGTLVAVSGASWQNLDEVRIVRQNGETDVSIYIDDLTVSGVDSTPPTITSVASTTANATYKVGDAISIQVVFSESVTVTGTPQLTLATGATDRAINYTSGSGTSTLTFTYTVQTGDTSADLDYLSTSALALNGGTIKDAAGNNATLTLAAPGAANSLGANKALVIDGVVPTVLSINRAGAAAADTNATSVSYTVTFSESVSGVDTSDFTLAATGTATGTLSSVSGSGSSYTVTVTGITGNGTLKVQLNGGTGITDAAGNAISGGFSSGESYTIDTAAPAAPSAPDLAAASDSGASNTDNITNATTPTITGTAEAGSTVTLYDTDGTTALGTATATGGNWSITSSALGQGTHTLTAKATDTAGNTSAASGGLAVTVDTAPPTTTIATMALSADTGSSGTDFITNTAAQTLSGTTSANMVAGEVVEVSLNNGASWSTATTSVGANNWSLATTLAASNTLQVRVTDTAGNHGTAATQAYVLDVGAPAAPSAPDMTAGSDTGASNTDNITTITTPTFTGTAESGATVHLYDTDGTTVVGTGTATGGNYSITTSALSAGAHTITAKATDTAGNTGVASAGLAIDIAAPDITGATYDASTGVLAVSALNMVTGDTIDVSKLTLTGQGGSYTLTSANVTAASAAAFSITLNAADKLAINGVLNQNGIAAVDSTTFNLAAAANWDATSASAADLTGNAVTVSNVTAPTIASATYDSSTHVLTATGTGLVKTLGATNDVSVTKLTLTGEGGATYTLTSSDVEVTSATSFSITLNATDQSGVQAIFNKNGPSSTGASTYNLAAADDWNSVITGGDIADATNAIIVSNTPVPTIASATYDATAGTLVVSGTGFLALSGAANDIVANKFTFTGEGGSTYTLTDSANVEITSGTSFTLTLSAADKAAIHQIVNKNGTSSTGATTYNLAAAEDWAAGADAAVVVADTTGNGITASNVAVPTITSATYDVTTGTLVVNGTGFLARSGATNDIIANTLTLLGQGGATYTLTDTANVDITSGTQFTLVLSATDKAAAALLLNKDGLASVSNTTYNIAFAEDWNAGADAAVTTADLTGNGVTVSGNDSAGPVWASASVNGNSLVLTYTDANALDAVNVAPFGAFAVVSGGAANAVTAAVVNGAAKTVTLTLTSAVAAGQVVTVAYTDPTGGNDVNAIQDIAGNDAASLGATAVVNNTPDTTPPVLSSATVTANQLVLNYTEATTLDAVNVAPAGAFAVAVDGVATAIASVTVNALAKTVTLSLATAVAAGQVVTVGYTDPTGGNDLSAIQDATGNDAASFAGWSATNLTPDVQVPDPVIPPPPPPPPGEDSDGIPAAQEDTAPGLPPAGGGVPLAGDGNGDGIKDSVQAEVASIVFVLSPTAQSNPGTALPTFTTLVASSQDGKVSSGTSNARITSLGQLDAPADLPEGLDMPIGLVSFTVALASGVSTEQFSLYLDPSLGVNGYWKKDSTGTWVNLASEPYGGKMVMEGGRLRLDFQLQDGGAFDADGKVDGVITDPGAPAHLPLSIVGQAPAPVEGGFWF